MGKVRHAIYLDDDVDRLLRERAAAMRVPPAVALRALVSALLLDGRSRANPCAPQALRVPGSASPAPEPLMLATSASAGTESACGVPGSASPGTESASPDPSPSSSSSSSDEEKEEEKKRRAEGKARKAEADRLFDVALSEWLANGGKAAGRTGNKVTARRRWHDIRDVRGLEASELLARVRRIVAAAPPDEMRFLPAFGEVLLWRNGHLDLESIAALEKRSAAARAKDSRRAPIGPETYDAEAAEETARRRNRYPVDPGAVEIARRNRERVEREHTERDRQTDLEQARAEEDAERQALMWANSAPEPHSADELPPTEDA